MSVSHQSHQCGNIDAELNATKSITRTFYPNMCWMRGNNHWIKLNLYRMNALQVGTIKAYVLVDVLLGIKISSQ